MLANTGSQRKSESSNSKHASQPHSTAKSTHSSTSNSTNGSSLHNSNPSSDEEDDVPGKSKQYTKAATRRMRTRHSLAVMEGEGRSSNGPGRLAHLAR